MENIEILSVLAASVALTALVLGLKKKRGRRQRRFWVNPYLMKRSEHGRYFSDVSANFHINCFYIIKYLCPLVSSSLLICVNGRQSFRQIFIWNSMFSMNFTFAYTIGYNQNVTLDLMKLAPNNDWHIHWSENNSTFNHNPYKILTIEFKLKVFIRWTIF